MLLTFFINCVKQGDKTFGACNLPSVRPLSVLLFIWDTSDLMSRGEGEGQKELPLIYYCDVTRITKKDHQYSQVIFFSNLISIFFKHLI